MAVGDSITPGYNPATFTLGCGFTKTDDNVSTTPDQTCTAGTLTIDGKYNIYFRRRLRETKQYEDVGGNAGVGGYRLYTAANKAAYLTGAGASTANIDMIEFVMCTNTIEVIAESALTGVIDKESVPIVADGANGTQGPEGPAGRDVGENLIDGTGEVKVIDSFDGSGADGVSRWYSNMFTLNDVNLSPNMSYSCQMRIKLEGCDPLTLKGRNVRLHLNTKGNHYPFICEFNPTENGTYTIKKENFHIGYASEGFYSGVTFGWDLSIGGDISLGTITIDKVKLEVGEKCTTWCLSENDKKGENTPYYHDTYYGWSASASTAVANTDPGDVTWARNVPSKPADKPYLWMRDRVMTWSSSARRYIEGSYTYTRITGENGTGVRINGSFTKSDWYGYGSIELYLRETYPNPTTGDCYIYQEDGHLWVWNGTTWQDVGRIKGTDGTSQYIHWAWCNTLGPTDQGDEGYPDWTGLNTGFTTTKDAEAKYKYIGVLANDTESPDPDEHYAGYYEWNEVEGPQGPAGKNSVRIDLSNQTDAIAADSNGKARFARTITTTAKVYDGATPVKSGVTVTAATITVVRNGVSTSLTSNPTYGSGGATFSWTIQEGDVLSTVSYPVSISLSYGSPSVAYTAEFTLTRIDAQAVFQLLPSRDSIDFVRQANNTLSPTNIQIWCGYKKYTGSGTETYASNYNGEGVTNFENSGYSIYVRHLKADGTPNIWDATGNTSPYGWIVMAYTGDYVRDIYSNTVFSAVQFCIAPAKDRTQWTDADIIDLETIPIVKDGTNGADGTSPWFADLDNEMDSVSCNASGVPSSTQTVSTNISLFYGINKKEFSVGVFSDSSCTHAYSNSSTLSSGIAVWWTSGNHDENTVNVKLSNAYTFGSDNKLNFYIKLTAKDDSTVGRVLTFTINGVRPGEDGEPATLYTLRPSMDVVTKDEDGIPTTDVIRFKVYKRVGSVTTEITSISDFFNEGLTLWYSKGGASEEQVTRSKMEEDGSLVNYNGIENMYYGFTGVVDWILKKNGTVVDREGIGSVKDGEQGDDAVTYEIVFTEAWARKDSDNYVTGRLKGNAYKIEGATRTALANATIRYGYTGGIYGETTTNNNGYFDDQNYFDDRWDDTSTCNYAKSIYASIRINNVAVRTEYINISFDGSQGQRGATGRMYFMQGKWDANTTYRRTTERIPLVLYSDGTDWNTALECYGHYYYLNADSATGSDVPGVSSKWVLCDEFAVVISRGIFAEFAKLGSFVISGDWMISQTAVSGSPEGAYNAFNPDYPNSAAPNNNNFIPVYAVDGRTGKVYMNDAEVAGTINASTIKGTIVVGDNTNAKAYMEIVPTTEVTEGSDQVYRADILGKSAGIACDALDIGVYRLKNSTVMGSHITVREVTTGGTVNGIAHVSPNEIVVADGIGNNAHETSIRPLGINTEDIVADTVYSETEVTTKKVKGVDSEPVAFPSNIITSDRVELDNNLPAGAIIFAPNCEYVKSSKDNVYASRNNGGLLDNLTTTKGHKFGNKASRIFVKYSTEYWKEFDCQGP